MVVEASFGHWVQRRRKALDLTQEELAQKVGCAAETLRKIESNNRRPSDQIAERLAQALEVPEAHQAVFIKAARGNLAALDQLQHPTQDLLNEQIQRRELEIYPQPETGALYRQIRKGEIKPIQIESERKRITPPHNLPLQLSRFIGREKEIGEIKKRLQQYRLVTLTGSGGIGKTRLLLQVATEVVDYYPDGVWFAELASLTDPCHVTLAVCTALELTPQGHTPILDMLTDYLRPRKLLLVIDNCEHLIDACAELFETLLHACPELCIFASSREALEIDGESAYRVPSLSIPDPDSGLHAILESEAVKLFRERAKVLVPEFEITESNAPLIAQICQRLDGIALAIELAASRVKILKVEQIARRLDDTFGLLTGGARTALPRQQTLRGTIDWSYNLLSEQERTVLRRLSVLRGSWTLEAAEAICGNVDILDLLTHLVDKSLVIVDPEYGNEARYYLLETIRQYACEKLAEVGEGEQICARHLDYFLKLAQEAEPKLYGAGQIEWLQRLEDEYKNLRAALEWSLQGNITAGQELAAALWWACQLRGRIGEAKEWLAKMLAADTGDETSVKAKLLSGEGWFADSLEHSKESLEKSVALFRKLGDEVGAAFPLAVLASLAYEQSDYDRATQLLNESMDLFKRVGNRWGIRYVLEIRGHIAEAQGKFEQAHEFYTESLMICKEIGDQQGVGWIIFCLGSLAESRGQDEQAMELYEDALQLATAVKSEPVMSSILETMGCTLIRRGDYERGNTMFNESIELCRKMGDRAGIAALLRDLGFSARLQGDYSKARSMYLESLQLAHQIEDVEEITLGLIHSGKLFVLQGSPEKYIRMFGVAEKTVPNIQNRVTAFMRNDTEQFIETAQTALGEEAYTVAWEAGHQMSLNEAVAYALKELQ